jgi:hypothetical protein
MAVHQENPKTPPRDSGAGTDQDKVVWRAARNLIAPPPLDDLHCEGKGLDLRGRKKRRSEARITKKGQCVFEEVGINFNGYL